MGLLDKTHTSDLFYSVKSCVMSVNGYFESGTNSSIRVLIIILSSLIKLTEFY